MSFQRFLSLVEALRQSPTYPEMDPIEERMLNAMAAAWHADTRLTVMSVMHMFPTISPSTVHRRLKSLRAKGLIELAPDLEDNRIKYVQATGRTEEYFALLGRCMVQAQAQP
ncbi:winged helix-turn-helix domain-containing protein [Malikia spinosa]|jgi:DNA-binding MarR family transcriptional regulator|uniref:winged helix-turn-helix domain-containing protein n=1 Tax=Malikia spinosa TaxID=86180 RepID=UPI003239332E